MAKKPSVKNETPSYDDFIQDTAAGLSGPAKNQEERHATLIYCVGYWSDEDVALIERVDKGADHGWGMDRR